MTTLDYRFLLRGGTSSDIATGNPIPLDRELWIEIDTNRGKRGDGVTAYNSLPYVLIGDIDLAGLADGNVLVWDATALMWKPGAGGGGGGGGGGVFRPPGSAYAVAATDDGKTLISGDATSFALTLPSDATVSIPIGAKIAYAQGAAGPITITGSAGVTVRAPNGNTTGALFDGGVAEKIGTDEWQLWNGPALGPLATVADAPSDSKIYGRKNGTWAEAVGGGAGGGGITAMNEQTGDYTLLVGDATKAIRATKTTVVNVTIPAGVLPVLCTVPLFQGGAGVATYVAGAGVTLESPNGVATTAVGDFRTAFQRATDVWVIG